MRFLIMYCLIALACCVVLSYTSLICREQMLKNGWFSELGDIPEGFSEIIGYIFGIVLISFIPVFNVVSAVCFTAMLFIRKGDDF